jgi:hypothetical protein
MLQLNRSSSNKSKTVQLYKFSYIFRGKVTFHCKVCQHSKPHMTKEAKNKILYWCNQEHLSFLKCVNQIAVALRRYGRITWIALWGAPAKRPLYCSIRSTTGVISGSSRSREATSEGTSRVMGRRQRGQSDGRRTDPCSQTPTMQCPEHEKVSMWPVKTNGD